jgi:hypothetical protein
MNERLRKLAIILIIISIAMITTGLIIELTEDYICNNTTDIEWFIKNCEVEQ